MFIRYAKYVLSSALELASTLLLIRAILSWIPSVRGTKLDEIITFVTDPLLMPFRRLFDRLGISTGTFIDWSFLATILTLQLLAAIL